MEISYFSSKLFLTGFEKASDVYLQYTLLCEIFRKTFCEIFCAKYFPNTVSRNSAYVHVLYKAYQCRGLM